MIAPWRRVLGRRLGPLLLGLLLLLAQAGFLAHHLSHSLEHAHLDDPACETCLAFAPLGGTLASANLSLDVFSQPGPFEAAAEPPGADRALADCQCAPRSADRLKEIQEFPFAALPSLCQAT